MNDASDRVPGRPIPCAAAASFAVRRHAKEADVLSDVLATVRLRGVIFFDVHAGGSWVAEAPASTVIAAAVLPDVDHVMEFHVVVRGRCWASLVGGPAVELAAGDIVVFPQGHAHVIASEPDLRGVTDERLYQRPSDGQLPIRIALNVSGEADDDGNDHVVCGFFGCSSRPFNPLIGSLPPMLTARATEGAPDNFLALFVDRTFAETRAANPGSTAVVNKLSELMFVEVVRQHLRSSASPGSGWLAGLRDPHVARALGLIHGSPGDSWTLARLARAAGMSRSGFAQRFGEVVGIPPMQYLTRWRMQVAAERLTEQHASLSEVASEVGYGSEAAFLRAFKKNVGTSPGAWRKRHHERGLDPAS